MATTFTIFFDGHLWVGVLEQRDGGQIRAARVVFGREPSGAEIEDWLRRHGNDLIGRAAAAQPIDDGGRPTGRARRPKRAQRGAARQARRPPAPRAAAGPARGPHGATASQQALAADREARAAARAQDEAARRRRDRKEARARRRARARARHRGR